jgi:Do/DeqQ family serine protease
VQNWKRTFAIVALAAFLSGALFAGGNMLVNTLAAKNLAVPPGLPAAYAQADPASNPDAIADIVSSTGPAVVKVDVYKTVNGTSFDPFFNDPFFRQFFGAPFTSPQPREEHGLGSGFIVTPDGYILTNEHVVDGAQRIEVTIAGQNKALPARVVGSDYDLDLAVLKVDAGNNLPTLRLGDSDQVKVGSWVVAIGNPYGLDHTVTVGVVSAKSRPVQVENRSYTNLLQTDAAINPGNSGGPLLNLSGEVIGINTAVAAQAQGIGFAIPINTVKGVLQELMNKGHITRPWMGVQVQPLNEQLAAYFGLKSTTGALVSGIVSGSPAEKAGLQQGDVILKVDSQEIKSPDDLVNYVKNLKIGQKVVLLIERQGKTMYLPLAIKEKPAQQ